MRFIFIILVFVCINEILFSQASKIHPKKENDSYSYYINHSIGYGFDKKMPEFTISLSKSFNNKYAIGLKGGIYNYSQKTNEAITDFINPYYANLNAGVYNVQINSLDVIGTTYIAAFQASYMVNSKLTTDIGLGSAVYNKKTYSLNVRFSKPSRNAPPLKPSDISLVNILPNNDKNIWKLYVSAGLNYRFSHFGIGIYADNIYSAGLSAGVYF
jgi:hypothetical protein